MSHDLDAQRGEISKPEFEELETELRTDLVRQQYALKKCDFSLIVVVDGDDRIGVNECLNRLHKWVDARRIQLNVYDQPLQSARERPFFWRYWRSLPADSYTGLYVNAWAIQTIGSRAAGRISKKELARRIASMRDFEEQLVDDGALLLKFWIHLDRKASKKKLQKVARKPESYWRLEDEDHRILEHYDEVMELSKEVLEQTSSSRAPWVVVDGKDERFRDVFIGRAIRDALEQRLAAAPAPPAVPTPLPESENRFEKVDLGLDLASEEYKTRLGAAQEELSRRVNKARAAGRSMVLVFEGWDAAGKGGAIRRIGNALDARDYRVVSIAAPTDEEKARHYLWRFWRHLPGAGKITVFDRSWYGRVLVERIEGFASVGEWRRAYAEIASFERQLADHGTLVQKFWLHIDPDEQLRRFDERAKVPWKQHKITEEDYRNREHWSDYVVAAEAMFAGTHREHAPWHVIPANSKRWARVEVMETLNRAIKKWS